MQLFKVVVEYDDLEAIREWKQKIEEDARKNIGRCKIPYPAQIKKEVYAAVYDEYGYGMIENAAKVALKTVVGKDSEAWKKYEAIVVSAELVGIVGVQEIEKQPNNTEGGQNGE